MRRRLGVLVSGGGTNLQALLDAAADPAYPAEVAVVVADREGTGAVERAAAAGIATAVVRLEDHDTREAFTEAVIQALGDVDHVVSAGFMKLFTPAIFERWEILNVHPSLLPSFPGYAKKVMRDTLAYGVKLTGATIHFLDDGTDTGPIVMQEAVPVLPGDDGESLHLRIQAVEHRLLPLAVRLQAEGKLRRDGRAVLIDSP